MFLLNYTCIVKSLVTIIGRPNVGKSTFFNRLTETRDAIVDPTSGVTRDRKYGSVVWGKKEFNLVDTGGYISNSDDVFESQINSQVQFSIQESDLLLFLVDVTTGITDLDQSIADLIRKSQKPALLIVNKVDTSDKEVEAIEFYGLGIGEEFSCISSSNGYGTGDLLDKIASILPDQPEQEEDDLPRIAIVGKPNVGKSTFINTLLGEERTIVTDVAGTTRDATDTPFNAFNLDFVITDTAGMRRKAKVDDDLEFYSNVRTIKAVEKSDVCILLIDAEKGIGKQDVNIFYQIVEAKKGVVIVVNKWDLVEKDHKTHDKFVQHIQERIAPFIDVPIIFTSNVTRQRILKSLETALEVYQNSRQKIPTSKLNDYLLDVIEGYRPPAIKGKYIRIKYVTQLPSKYPAFAFFCNLPQYVKDPYKRFLENKIREEFDFTGVPFQIYMRKK